MSSLRRSSRVMALNGLRMMPLSPSPSLKFRTARFPRYGFKADISDGAFPSIAPLKLAPNIRSPMFGLLPSFAPLESQTLLPVLRREGALHTTPSFGLQPCPRGPRSGRGRKMGWGPRLYSRVPSRSLCLCFTGYTRVVCACIPFGLTFYGLTARWRAGATLAAGSTQMPTSEMATVMTSRLLGSSTDCTVFSGSSGRMY